MSNALAIAAVTETLRNRIEKVTREELNGGLVTTLPLDKVRENRQDKNQINIYLYQASSNAAWSNRNLPSRVKPGETGPQPLALNLFYLITPYSSNSNRLSDHKLLGYIMQTLNDYPVLGSKEIEDSLPESDLQNQIEKVRVFQIDLSLEDMSRIWSTCQTEYRLSVAYEASVVLIAGPRPTKTPLPVLGVNTSSMEPSLTPPQPSVPTLKAIELPQGNPSINLGEELTIQGYNLDGDRNQTRVIFDHPRLTIPIEIPPQPGGNDTQIRVRLEETRTDWLAGIYTVTLRIRRNNQQQTTNALSLFLSPSISIEGIELENNLRLLRIRCSPSVLLWVKDERLLQGQSVFLLLGDRELQPQMESLSSTPNNRTDTLVFDITNIQPGEYFVRLRIDGVDSLLVDRSVKPPVFDSRQKVTIS